ncbi:putative DNA-binding protein [Oceanisphaera litoralis]|uniref:hypothetical protein n=1 Tax=Oceanisphaera litoralis TaxID=225144 RepID=UPI00195C0EC1|nr:hypothetical protein [Oceanisphaera litoralis]MBM7457297.1 putative DNA-binding protein [Oceanisphaera litoralis]
MAAPKRDKITRTVRLDVEVDERLQVVCKRLGVTLNSFLIGAIGEAIVRHESQMRIESGVMDVIRDAIGSMVAAADPEAMEKRMKEALGDDQDKAH